VDSVEVLDNIEDINKIDRGEMLSAVMKTPELLLDAFELSEKVSLPKTFRSASSGMKIVISGMGGSAIAGEIVSDLLLNRAKAPIYVNRNYKLPTFVDSETLFFAISYSGHTEETLYAVKEAAKCEAKIVCITSGGKLAEIAERKGYPLYLIPLGYQPRAALPYLLVPILKNLEHFEFFSELKKGIDEAVSLLQKMSGTYGVDNPFRSNPVKQLAKKLQEKIPIVFAAAGTTGAVGLRLKNQFNENSKVASIFNVFPELSHNEIVGLSALRREEHDFSLILLRDEGESARAKKRIEITKSLIGNQLGGIAEIWSQGKSPLARILSLIFFGDFLSVYLAIMRGIDPTPIEIITRLKRELSR
jgi:glucose/mannose-6-phosphate isomerase